MEGDIFPGIGPMRLPPILWGALVKTMQAHGVAQRIPQQPQWLLLYYSASPAGNQRDSPCDNDMIEVIFTILVNGKCPSFSDLSGFIALSKQFH